jgi:NAD(P)-dependent dehydrogenase (short-subunit alcohol dehydrogenase family)
MTRSRTSARVAVVTGATGGMGRVIASRLAEQDWQVVTIARDPRRAEELGARIAGGGGGHGTLTAIAGDLSSRAGIRAAAEAISALHGAVHLLVNNVGAHYREHLVSPDGVEMHVAIDYLAAYGLTVHLDRQLRRGRARVVNVASDTIRDTRQVKLLGPPRPATIDRAGLEDLTTINAEHRFVPFEAYARAKLLTVAAGYALARTFVGDGVTVNAVHPGIVATDLIDPRHPPRRRHDPAQDAHAGAGRRARSPSRDRPDARRRDRALLRPRPRHRHAPGLLRPRRAAPALHHDEPLLLRRPAVSGAGSGLTGTPWAAVGRTRSGCSCGARA